jgi:hypothetical protein
MKTAVEWLYEQILLTPLDIRSINKCLEQAKEMEKEQIEDFFNAGVRYGSGSVMSTEWGEDTEEHNFEQYYNETYKTKTIVTEFRDGSVKVETFKSE